MNFCKDCKHFNSNVHPLNEPRCNAPQLEYMVRPDPVYGTKEYPSASSMRQEYDAYCGPDGRWFAPKSKPVPTDPPGPGLLVISTNPGSVPWVKRLFPWRKK